MNISNEKLADHVFVHDMVQDSYFPDFLVAKVQAILVRVCEQIESQKPADEAALLTLTHAATEAINDLAEEFYEHDSEIETMARECIAGDFMKILDAYGFGDVDIEDAIAPRDW